jgi:vancomycin resistance protein YoaR
VAATTSHAIHPIPVTRPFAGSPPGGRAPAPVRAVSSPGLRASPVSTGSGVWRLLAMLALGGAAGFVVVPDAHVQPVAAPVMATLDGKPLPLDGDVVHTLDAAHAIARAYVAQKITISVPGAPVNALSNGIARTREELGARVDASRLTGLVVELRDPSSALRRAHDQVARGRPLRVPLPVTTDAARAIPALLQVKDELDHAPQDARFDLEAGKVSPDEPGRRVDVYATLARLDDAWVKGIGAVDAVVETIPAQRTSAQLEGVKIDDVLGYFETRYARDQKHEARTFNLRLAASKLNGTVLFPGETFDLNEIVGPRTEANGYKVAPVIAQGELVDGIGGGTCQIAGTLHGAAFFAGMDIVERHPHTRPSFYIKMGMDAAVSYPAISLKLKNPFPFPIVLHETVKDGIVRAEVLGPKRTRDVTFVRKINEVTPFAERETPDPKIPKGARVLAQRGIPGFKITRYRILRDGAFAVREHTQDVYPPTAQIWRVGTGEPDPKYVSLDDEHPEYVADEYLVVTQGPDMQSPHAKGAERGGGTVESRVAGKYGTHGWTVREGFAKALGGKKSNASDDDDARPD